VVNLGAWRVLRIGGLRLVEITKYLGFGAPWCCRRSRLPCSHPVRAAYILRASHRDPILSLLVTFACDGAEQAIRIIGAPPPLSASIQRRFAVRCSLAISCFPLSPPDPGRGRCGPSGVCCLHKTSFGAWWRAGIQRPIWSPPSASGCSRI